MIDFKFDDPLIVKGKFLPLVKLSLTPNLLKGSDILLKSLFERLLSPTNLIVYGEFINKPKINLPNVPEFFASKTKFFLYLKPLIPFPNILHLFFLNLTSIPNFLIAFIADITSSDSKRFSASDSPLAKDEKRIHLILRLLSPLTNIFF